MSISYERSIQLLKPEGVFAFITSNKWYRANYGEKLREWINRNTRILSIIDFGDADVFPAIAGPTIMIAKRRKLPSTACGRGVGGISANLGPVHK
jgi:type II restriction/modification system DNA methylase subunit YeeA